VQEINSPIAITATTRFERIAVTKSISAFSHILTPSAVQIAPKSQLNKIQTQQFLLFRAEVLRTMNL
jgi:hypothetical protein